jgi:hypothetical protein
MSGSIHLQMGRLLVISGVALVVLGLIVMAGARLPSLGLGKLPGDVAFRGKDFQFNFPIVTCLILSAAVTAILWVISLLARK